MQQQRQFEGRRSWKKGHVEAVQKVKILAHIHFDNNPAFLR